MRVIDAHTHLGLASFIVRPIPENKRSKPAFKDRLENTVEALVLAMDRDGVERAVAFPYPMVEVDADQANAYVFEAAASYPDRIIPFALLDDEPGRWIAQGARGFKQHFLLEPARFDLATAYRLIAASGLPLIAHLDTGAAVAQAESILALAPDLRLIIAHMGRCEPNTGCGVAENLDALARHPRVFFETSTVRDPEAFRLAVRKVGPERICFGSDFPFNSHLDPDPLARELEIMRSAGLLPHDLERILGTTILTLTGGPS